MNRVFRIAALALALGIAPAALANNGYDEHGNRVGYGDRDDGFGHGDRDDGRFGGWDRMDRVQRLARQLAQDAAYVHRLAESQAHHFDRRERRAFEALHRLDAAAGRFYEMVDRYSRSAHGSEREFRSLIRVFTQAANAMERLHAYGQVYVAFDRVQNDMDRLVRFYGGYDVYGYSRLGRGHWFRGPGLELEIFGLFR